MLIKWGVRRQNTGGFSKWDVIVDGLSQTADDPFYCLAVNFLGERYRGADTSRRYERFGGFLGDDYE